MNDEIKYQYNEETILYEEWNNQWKFGEKYFVGLKQAKEYIDKMKKTKFSRFEVFYDSWGNYQKGTVTSIVDNDYWITDSNGKRGKYDSKHVYPICAENDDLISQMFTLKVNYEKLQSELGYANKQIGLLGKQLKTMNEGATDDTK